MVILAGGEPEINTSNCIDGGGRFAAGSYLDDDEQNRQSNFQA